ncbi:AMIN domain-containing protein [Desulfonema magnum]|uniref:AMIN domain-containing protein n=1 Tax=Desulfonema magnum TaxID=45655 RepID=A0A975BF76_9BACT|nr:AMIN domain-containing protein [Desulfonema magnum]QTA84331.1 AMIN domain-containing protein [Desulfonema magnum]
MKCPNCGSDKVTYSHTRGVEKFTQYLWPKAPYRCKECWTRFWKFKSASKIIVGLSVVVIPLLCLAAAMWFFFLRGEQKTPPPRFSEEKEIFKEEKQATEPTVTEEVNALLAKQTEQSRTAGTNEMLSEQNEVQKGQEQPVISDKNHEKNGTAANPESSDKTVPTETQKTLSKKAESVKKARVSKSRNTLRSLGPKASEGEFGLVFSTADPIRNYKHFPLDETPPKVVIDLLGKWNYSGRKTLRVQSDMVSRVRIGEHDDKLRVVLDLKGNKTFTPKFEESPQGLVMTIKK